MLAYDLIESIVANTYQWPTTKVNFAKKVAGVLELNKVSTLSTQIASLANMLKVVTTSSPIIPAPSVASPEPVVVEQNIFPVDSISFVPSLLNWEYILWPSLM